MYEPPTLSAEETKRFSQHREQDFESQVCVCVCVCTSYTCMHVHCLLITNHQHVQYIKAKRKKETTHSACEDEIRQAKKPRLDVTSSIDSFSPLVHIHTQDTTPRTHPLYDSWNYPGIIMMSLGVLPCEYCPVFHIIMKFLACLLISCYTRLHNHHLSQTPQMKSSNMQCTLTSGTRDTI